MFHEECLHQWFKSQENTYLDTERQHGDYRDSSPHPSEAPTECPTCRQECFLTEDGKYDTKRLYINWGEQDGSSMAGSSPVRATPTQTRRGTGPSEVMLLARRAKALGAEVGDMSADSQPEDIKGLQRRAEGLKRDLEDLKGVEGIRVSLFATVRLIRIIQILMSSDTSEVSRRHSTSYPPIWKPIPYQPNYECSSQRKSTRWQNMSGDCATWWTGSCRNRSQLPSDKNEKKRTGGTRSSRRRRIRSVELYRSRKS